MAQKRTEEEVEGLLRRYHARGSVTRRVFCENETVSLSTLYYFRTPGSGETYERSCIRVRTAELAHLISAAESA